MESAGVHGPAPLIAAHRGDNWTVWAGDSCLLLPTIADRSVDHVIADPQYSEHVHSNSRTNKGGQKGGTAAPIQFAYLDDATRAIAAKHFARIVKRWVLVFCDLEGAHLWREELELAGLEYIRTGLWIKGGAMPQQSGDRPANGAEAIVICHRKGKKRWNGGGLPAIYHHPIVRGAARDNRPEHETPKPISLMRELVDQYTDKGDLILDGFAGGCTTGVAALLAGRRFHGIDIDPAKAAAGAEWLAGTQPEGTMAVPLFGLEGSEAWSSSRSTKGGKLKAW